VAANDLIAVLDLEWTSWEGARARRWRGPGEEMEIVQIGAVTLCDDDALSEAAALDLLVTPRINPRLSDYFIDLTGITQARLDAEGVTFADALAELRRFLVGIESVYSYGTDYTVIRHNCTLNGVAFPFDEALFKNARELVVAAIGPEVAGIDSSRLPDAMGFPPPGTAHQAVDDCRCIAETLRILRRRGKF